MTKRFFRFDDESARWWVTASDQDHAQRVLDETGMEFGDPSTTIGPALLAGNIRCTELSPDEAAKVRCDTSEDDRGRGKIPMTEFDLGEWCTTEW